ncbi:TAR DNA-binding protein 43-like protein [Dinothrombium tinctorium]|uniref:TAR DNA-binding protein 43 n=1 Tax=Dinothrombium tinctorium TaxID=1965070 RepID=A0A3S3SBD8_9ACAR|nr:TAR DNA-binding protein 43-like protein [Dinothrombium tinctorium]
MSVCYVAVCESENEKDDSLELPCEEDGTMLLSTLTSQFPGASGLKYRNAETGAWRGIRLVDNRLQPPERGWSQHSVYCCVFPKGNKRKNDEANDAPSAKTKRSDHKSQKCSDLIVLGLPWKTTESELREYFEQFGEVLMAQVKKDAKSGLSKGFGFIRFADYEVQMRVISKRHNIAGRWCDVRIPLSRGEGTFNYQNSEFNRKIFVGRLTEDISTEDLKEYFSKYGEIADVFIPKPFRAFAFVTFYESDVAQSLCGEDHIVKGVSVHVSNAVPKVDLSVNAFGGPVNSSPHGGYGSSLTNSGMNSVTHQQRYSHQPYHYSAYDSRRAASGPQQPSPSFMNSNSPYGSGGNVSGAQGSPQIWSGALGAHVTQGTASGDLPALAALGSRLGIGQNNASNSNSLPSYGMAFNQTAALQLAAALAGHASMSLFGQNQPNLPSGVDAAALNQSQTLGWASGAGPASQVDDKGGLMIGAGGDGGKGAYGGGHSTNSLSVTSP